MVSIKFDDYQERLGEHGVNRCVVRYKSTSYPWNGIIGITEERVVKQPTYVYFDGRKINSRPLSIDRNYTIDCFTYPDIVEELLGVQTTKYGLTVDNQERKKFDLLWSSNLIDGVGNSYKKLNFLYNAYFLPPDVNYQTDSTNIQLQTFKLPLEVYPTDFGVYGDQYKVVIDERKTPKDLFDLLEKNLYGTEKTDPVWYSPEALLRLYSDQNYKVGSETNVNGIYNIVSGNSFRGSTSEGLFTYIPNQELSETSTNGLYR